MNLLAFDTGTEWMSIAVARTVDGQVRTWQHGAAGGARASTELIPGILDLLQQADVPLAALDAICFGAGPGSFTGLRTACSVAQGLAFGVQVPVLAMDCLLAVAEEARFCALASPPRGVITALLDARMQEMYAATYAFEGSQWTPVGAAGLLRPQDLGIHLRALSQAHQPVDKLQWHLAGNVFAAYGEFTAQASASIGAACGITALPSASAMLRLAPHLLLSGKALKAEQALPFYIRDKVALTTLERVADQAARAQGV